MMKISSTQKKWALLGILMLANGLMVSNWLDERSHRARLDRSAAVEAHRSSQAPTGVAKAVRTSPDARIQTAAAPTEAATPRAPQPHTSQPPVRGAVRTASAIAPPDPPVYIGHTDRVALQPRVVQALRQLIDTSHKGLKLTTLPNGVQVVNTSTKFLHVAVAATTPDGNVVQQDFSTRP